MRSSVVIIGERKAPEPNGQPDSCASTPFIRATRMAQGCLHREGTPSGSNGAPDSGAVPRASRGVPADFKFAVPKLWPVGDVLPGPDTRHLIAG